MSIRTKLILTAAASALIATGAFAQNTVGTPGAVDPNHPRVNEVDQRLQNQQNRVDAGVANGTITPKQAGHDEARDARIEQKAQSDEAANGGHLTKGEQRHLNKRLDKNSQHIANQSAQ